MINKIITNIKKMMKRRGIKIENEYDEDNEKMIVNRNIIILFYLNDKIKIDTVKEINKDYSDYKHLILITTDKITSKANKELIKLDQSFEIFYKKNILTNIIEHELQPEFKLLSKREADIIYKLYGNKMGKMLSIDPVAKYFNAEQGNIFEIKRKTGQIYYRYVIKIEK